MPKCSANTVASMMCGETVRVAAKDAVDLGALQPGIRNRQLGGLAHQIERGRTFVLAVGCQPDAGDEAHVNATSQ